MNTSLSKSCNFPMPSLSIASSFSSTITIFSEVLSSWISLKIKLVISKKSIMRKRYLLDFISILYFFSSVIWLCWKNCKLNKSNNMIGWLKLIVFWLDGKGTIKCQFQSIIFIYKQWKIRCGITKISNVPVYLID